MNNEPLILEAVNLFCGSEADVSNHLILTEIRLPSLEKNYVDHIPGGSSVAIEIDVNLTRLEATFTLAGWQPQVLRLMGAGEQLFTVVGLVRNRRSGRALQAEAIIRGRLNRATPSIFTRGAVSNFEYAIRSIMRYSLSLEDSPIFHWDFYEPQAGSFQREDPASRLRRQFPGALD